MSELYARERARITPVHESTDPRHVVAVALCTSVGEALAKYYPRHRWRVAASADCSTVNITHDGLGWRYGMVLHALSLHNVADMERKVMRAGGELLERYGVSREPIRDMAAEFWPRRHLVPYN